MTIKYQIFISSTYEDLKEERRQAIMACLESDHIPVGMEMFSGTNDEQWNIITRLIDDSDYFIIIVANKYGSVLENLSYTEREFDYAVSKGVPILAFVLSDKATWPSDLSEKDNVGRRRLAKFKEKISSKFIKFWINKEQLYGQIGIAIQKAIKLAPRTGWIRTPSDIYQVNQNVNVTVNNGSDEAILSLMTENARLRLEVFNLSEESLIIIKPLNRELVPRIILAEGFVKDVEVEIWPIIRSVSGSTYWVQARADIDNAGKWRAKVIIGQDGSSDIGAVYQLVIVINPNIELKVGDELINLPKANHISEPIEITRK